MAAETGGRRAEYRYGSSGRLIEEVEGERRRIIHYDESGLPATMTRATAEAAEQLRLTFNGDGLLTSVILGTEASPEAGPEEEAEYAVRRPLRALDRAANAVAHAIDRTADIARHETAVYFDRGRHDAAVILDGVLGAIVKVLSDIAHILAWIGKITGAIQWVALDTGAAVDLSIPNGILAAAIRQDIDTDKTSARQLMLRVLVLPDRPSARGCSQAHPQP